MTKKIVFEKSNFFLNTPDWRYRAVHERQHKLQPLIRTDKQRVSGQYLARRQNTPQVESYSNDRLTLPIQRCVDQLSQELKEVFSGLRRRRLRKRNLKKNTYAVQGANTNSFNTYKYQANKVTDSYIQRLLGCITGVHYDSDIAFALVLHDSPSHREVFRYIGYMVYLGLSDIEIAGRWRMRVRQIEFLRSLFFDFTMMPRDVIANTAYLRQLAINQVFTEADLHFYKLLNDLGELGLRAMSAAHYLTEEEKSKVEAYASSSLFEYALRLRTSVRSKKDVMEFSSILNSLGSRTMRARELEFLEARIVDVKTNTRKASVGLTEASSTLDHTTTEALQFLEQGALAGSPALHTRSLTDLT